MCTQIFTLYRFATNLQLKHQDVKIMVLQVEAMEFITDKLIMIALFILIIHSIETLAYAVRLSGARVLLLASALSLFNVMVIVSRLSNMMQQPFTGNLVDKAPSDNALIFVDYVSLKFHLKLIQTNFSLIR